MFRFLMILLVVANASPTWAAEPARDTLYLTITLRAAPGQLKALIADHRALKEAGYYAASGRHQPLIMRHSQGDQWDLMLLEPIGSYGAFFGADRLVLAEAARIEFADQLKTRNARIAYRAELFAFGPSAEFTNTHVGDAKFFHIEMFDALPALKDKLLEQREMENVYLEATKRRGNLIFTGDRGTNVDAFTIGAYENLAAFAARPDLEEGQSLAAAKKAGFEDDNSIGFYLRELISAHHDTLANLIE
ncbi:MAG: hypothetical protein COA47_01525 [Robiginitomaculum sp.]|nr:MAG: hypothetical protein COA47_01525 [Robiginitomaculum sp.]